MRSPDPPSLQDQLIEIGMRSVSAVVIDKSPHPVPCFAVILRGDLLPMRFSSEREAGEHLLGLGVAWSPKRGGDDGAAG